MTRNRHRAVEIERAGHPDLVAADAVVVAVHGRNQGPDYLREHLIDRLDRAFQTDVAWLLPAADASSWYPEGFLAPIERNQPDLDHALEVMTDVESLVGERDPASVVWVGFSQGACLVAEHVGRRPRRWGGLAALTGGRIGPDGLDLTIAGDLGGLPAYFGAGERDDWVPAERVRATADAYRAAGADVTVEIFDDDDHVIRDAEVAHVARLVATARSA